MAQTFTAVGRQDGDCWLGWIEEVPGVNCQEGTRQALLETLRITLAEALELNRGQPASGASTHERGQACEPMTRSSRS